MGEHDPEISSLDEAKAKFEGQGAMFTSFSKIEEDQKEVIKHACDDDFTSFQRYLPEQVSNEDARSLYNEVRKNEGLERSKNFRKHFDVGNECEIREQYVQGKLFQEDDQVMIKETKEVVKVIHCGSNYVIVEFKDGMKNRKWLDHLQPLDGK